MKKEIDYEVDAPTPEEEVGTVGNIKTNVTKKENSNITVKIVFAIILAIILFLSIFIF